MNTGTSLRLLALAFRRCFNPFALQVRSGSPGPTRLRSPTGSAGSGSSPGGGSTPLRGAAPAEGYIRGGAGQLNGGTFGGGAC